MCHIIFRPLDELSETVLIFNFKSHLKVYFIGVCNPVGFYITV
jgi:hypothetical protein